MKILIKMSAAVLATAALFSCSGPAQNDDFWRVEDGMFVKNGTPNYYIGTNFWYGPILASDGEGGDWDRLTAELDSLKELGLTNLRVLAGADGPAKTTKVSPALLTAPGQYNDTLLVGLDRFLVELSKREMTAVIYLNNAWEWSGGYGQWLEWAGAGEAVIPAVDGWPAYMKFASQFVMNAKAKALATDHLRYMVSRVNTVTGKPYKDDPTIFSWQLCNEPRCFDASQDYKDSLYNWLTESAALIKSIDPNHMVSTGSEGLWGCEGDIDLCEKIHGFKDIDYWTIHIWPYNWSWVREHSVVSGVQTAIANTDEYIDNHLWRAAAQGKPLVIEEFGYPRDGFAFAQGTPTTARDEYYGHIFSRIAESKAVGGALAGCNFWGWGGLAGQSPVNMYWTPGDDYCGDPAHEQQGLNSVYMCDESTIQVIKDAVAGLSSVTGVRAKGVLENDWMYGSDAPARLKVAVRNIPPTTADAARQGMMVRLTLLKDVGDTVQVIDRPVTAKLKTTVETFDLGLEPGFWRVCLSAGPQGGEMQQTHSFNIGCDPEKIVSPADPQPDFDEFWAEGLAQLAEVAPQYRRTLLPEHSNDVRRTYRVDMTSWNNEPISGILIEPVAEGKYPVYITYMGYGSTPWYNDPSARPEAIEFTLSIRNQALNRAEGEPDDWCIRGLSSKDTYYYRGAFLDAVRAVDFVASLEKADTTRIFAEGGSQGGALTLAAASLDHRIKGIAPFVPFLSDFPDYFRIASWPMWPITQEAKRLGMSDEELYKTLSYFDIKNFTSRIECPVLMGFGLQDPVCPPHTNFSGYNLITTPKSYITFPLAGHQVEREAGWWQARDAFFAELQ